jgi:large subunit ribosomal protein L6
MSRLGKLPIKLPVGVQATIKDQEIVLKGPKGELKLTLHPVIEAKIENNEILIAPKSANKIKNADALWGLFWSLVNNLVTGVSVGFTKKLEINGVGYRATASAHKLDMNLGFSHLVEFKLPLGVTATVEGNTITLSSADKSLVGETAAQIRKIRKPEPYKGKGIKYSDEIIRRKAGKAAAKSK